MGKAMMIWDSAADQKLLLAILALHEIKVDTYGVAASLGPPCNAISVKNRLAKLRSMAKEQKDSGNGDPGSTSVKATAKAKNPSGRKPAAKKGTLEIKSLAVTGDRDEGNTSSKETNPNGKVSISNSAANSKQENKRKATEVQGSDDDKGNLRKKVKIEDVDPQDSHSILHSDPSSDQLMAEYQASEVTM